MGVLEHHQHRPVPRLGCELAEHCLEQFLAFALRAKVEVCGGTRQRQQLAHQRDIVVAPRARREQCPQLPKLLNSRVVAGEPGGAFELSDEGVERAVLVVRRAEIAQARMWLGSDVLGQGSREPRLADARLARDQHHSSFAALRLLPTADKQLDFLVTPDEGSQASCMQRFEPAFHRTCAQYRPGVHRPGDALEVLCPKVLKLEQIAEQFSRAFGNDHPIRLGDALQTRREAWRLANDGLLL